MAADVPVHEFLSAGYRIAGNLLRGELYRSGRVERQVKKKRRAATALLMLGGRKPVCARWCLARRLTVVREPRRLSAVLSVEDRLIVPESFFSTRSERRSRQPRKMWHAFIYRFIRRPRRLLRDR
jgi:hypothetical protein